MSALNKSGLQRGFWVLAMIVFLSGLSSCFKPPLCTVPGCHVRYKHPHQGVMFRGQKWYKLNQNPKTGQDYTTIRERTKKRKLLKEEGKYKNSPTIKGRGQGPESSGGGTEGGQPNSETK